MGKNIIICNDGTGNEYGRNNTNVVHAYDAFVRDDKQLGFYDPGVGTFNVLGRRAGKYVGRWLGLGFGWGLQANVEDAYAYLMDHYEPGDRIYLFGFSRGAFTVRAIAGMLAKCGLLQKGSKNLIPYASRIYNARYNKKIAQGFKDTYGRECKPYFVGVWDTVASLGRVYGRRFFDATLHEDIKFGYHAVSIDERRKKFPVSLWDETKKTPAQTITQVWFAGVHSDVGGWYDERGLSDTALEWMLENAEQAGLRLKPGWKTKTNPDPTGKNAQHESWEGFWRLWPRVRREIPEGALIHQSVVDRIGANVGYDPPNLPKQYSIVPWSEGRKYAQAG
ncbi:MAG: DUF2235 domain-containing protein [Planctomycetota bacterium]|jgi:uncharacterized protein (DUF2235 family)